MTFLWERAVAPKVQVAMLWLFPLFALALRLGLDEVSVGLVLAGYRDVFLLPAWWLLARTPGRKRWLALPFCLWQLLGLIPFVEARTPPAACGESITVVTANLLMVHPDPRPLTAELKAMDADIYLFQEYSSRWDEALSGLREHGYTHVQDDSFGTAIYSRWPLEGAETVELGGVLQAHASVSTPIGRLELLDAHTLPPRSLEYLPLHLQGLRDIEGWIRTATGEFLVAGDFNAGPRAAVFRRLRGVADDAWELAGSGPGYTWPNGLFPLPPARLDHVLVPPTLTVTEIQVGVGAGSDHRPVRAVLARRCDAFSVSP